MASDISSQYPFLSDKDLKDYINNPEKLEFLNKIRENDLNGKIANFSLSENRSPFNVEIPSQSNARDDLRLVIVGKTGQGKSATANTILGKDDSFAEDNTSASVTRESRRITELVDGRKISVMDTPGLQDTHQCDKRILKELTKITTLFPDGVHAFVYVMNMADPRFTAEDKNVLDLIEKTFGGDFKNYCLLVFSHGDSALKDTDLDTYRNKQMEMSGYPSEQYSRQDSIGKEQGQEQNSLAKLIEELSWKMLAIDNKTSIPFEKAHYRKQIVAMVDRMRKSNSPDIYTNDMFVKAQQQRKAMKKKGLKKGWDPAIMNKVETILAANPEISREELQAEVRRQLQVENKEKLEKEQREMKERQSRQKQEEDILRRRKEEESGRLTQKEQEEEKIQEQIRHERIQLENMLSKIKKEEFERQMKRKEEEQERKEWLEEEMKQFELRQRQLREERLREMEEVERRRQELLEREELERQKRREQEDMERERRIKREREERKQAEKERRQRENTERLQREREEQVDEIADEHMRMWEKAISGAVAIAKTVIGWLLEA